MKKKEKKYGFLKGVLVLVCIALVLSWLIPNGALAETGFQEGVMTRIGLNDLSWIFYYTVIYFSIDKIMFLLAIGGLYGVLTRTSAYNNLVTSIAKKLSGNKKLAVVLFSVLIAGLTSILTQTFAVVLFIPFIISILNKMKLDKMTIFATTFGSLLVGILGATYGTEGAVYLNNYLVSGEQTIHDLINATILVRAGILVIGLLLFNFFTINHMNTVDKNASGEEIFPLEEIEEDKRKNKLPIIILGLLTFIIVILAFINWNNNFLIDTFTNFHESLFKVKIGGDFYIIKDLLGANIGELGTWDLFSLTAVVFIFTLILGLCYRMHFEEFVDNFKAGAKKMLLPCLVVVGAFLVMVIVYMSPYIATIINKFLSMTDGFNLATMTLSSFIANIFHADLGYTGYILGSYLAVEYVDYLNPIYVILTSTYGFVQFFAPTSVILGVGLTTLNVKYKEWLSYIWKFLVGMLICLLVIFILLTLI